MQNLKPSRRDLIRLGLTELISGCAPTTLQQVPRPTSAQPLNVESFTPDASSYESLVRGYNVAYHSVRPRLITLPRTQAEVIEVLSHCQREGWALHLRAGGHSFEDLNTGSGVLLDLRRMNGVEISPDKKTVSVQAGATLGKLHQTVLPQGLSLPSGTCPGVGVAGLTMGGGYGMLSRKYGLTCDSLLSVEVIAADGRVHTASAQEHPALFWALRGGGGGNFGIATRFTFTVRRANAKVCVLKARVRPDLRRQFLAFWQSWISDGDDALTPLVYVAATSQGIDGPVVLAQYSGKLASARLALEPFMPFLDPNDLELSELAPLRAFEFFGGKLDAAMTPARFKSKSHFFKRQLSDAQWDAFIEQLNLPIDGLVGLMLDPWQGAIARVPVNDTAFVHRDALFSVQYRADWITEAEEAAGLECLQRLYTTLTPLSDGAYVNYSDKSLPDWRTAYYGAHLQRLTEVKRQYDPNNYFRHPLSL